MNINYLILAYDNHKQLARIINSITTSNTWFYIHIDKKSKRELFIQELSELKNISFVDVEDSEDVIWADFSTVAATLKCLNLVNNLNKKGYCVLISEHDYPVKTNEEIINYFESNYGKIFIATNLLNFEYDNSLGTYNQRIISYKFNLSSKKSDFVIIPSIWNKIFFRKKTFFNIYKLLKNKKAFNFINLFFSRKAPIIIDHYWGSQWWAIPNENIKEILDFININPKTLAYYKYTLAVDELFFQTILKYIDTQKTSKSIFDVRPTFMKWQKTESSPKILLTNDFDELISLPNRFLFARKFNERIDSNILDMLDIHLKNK
jgi:hypothetical protein